MTDKKYDEDISNVKVGQFLFDKIDNRMYEVIYLNLPLLEAVLFHKNDCVIRIIDLNSDTFTRKH